MTCQNGGDMAKIVRGWDNQEIGVVPAKGENPMLVFGYGPDGATCKDCVQLQSFKQSATWHRCALRVRGNHKVSWPACKKYEARGTEAAQ